MARSLMTLACLAILSLGISGATDAQAQTLRYQPPYVGGGQPVLGFTGHMEYGYGMRIDRVWPGSAAHSAGLERGDVIVRVNGMRFHSHGQYLALLRMADGYVRLAVDDVRGRGIVGIGVHLDNGSGPVVVGAPAYARR